MGILLTDEEIVEAIPDGSLAGLPFWEAIAKGHQMVAEAQLKKVVGWLKEVEEEDVIEDGTDNWYLGIPAKDWQSLLKEVATLPS